MVSGYTAFSAVRYPSMKPAIREGGGASSGKSNRTFSRGPGLKPCAGPSFMPILQDRLKDLSRKSIPTPFAPFLEKTKSLQIFYNEAYVDLQTLRFFSKIISKSVESDFPDRSLKPWTARALTFQNDVLEFTSARREVFFGGLQAE